jgi:hypothetical protein
LRIIIFILYNIGTGVLVCENCIEGDQVLSDIERKVLRILYNFSSMRKSFPSIELITIKTGKSRSEIQRILDNLKEKHYIDWDQMYPNRMMILEAWEKRKDRPSHLLKDSL